MGRGAFILVRFVIVRHRCMFALAILAFWLARPAAGDALGPGLHKGLPSVDPLLVYDLYLPRSYTPTSSLPVAIIVPGKKSIDSDWETQRMAAWAEQNNSAVFVLMSVPMPREVMDKIHADESWQFRTYVEALDRIPGLDHHVRVATWVHSPGGNGGMALWFATLCPGAVSGVVFDVWNAGPDEGKAIRPVDYLALVELHPSRAAWARTPLGPADRYQFLAVDVYMMKRNHWEWNAILGRDKAPFTMFDASCVDELDLDVVDDALEYLVDSVLLTLPSVAAPRRQAAADAIAQRLEAAKSETNPLVRYRITDIISRLQALKATLHADALAAWRSAAVEIIDPQPDDLTRYELLTQLLADPRMKGAKETKSLTARLKILKDDPQCKREVTAHGMTQEIIFQEWAGRAGDLQRQQGRFLKPGEPIIPNVPWRDDGQLIKLLNEVIARYPGTFGARESQMEINWLREHGAK